MITDKEADALNRTGMFLTIFNWTWDGDQIRMAMLSGVVIVLAILAII